MKVGETVHWMKEDPSTKMKILKMLIFTNSILLIFLLVILLFCFSVTLFIRSERKDFGIEEKRIPFTYQSLRFHPQRNETYVGMVSTFKEIEKDGFLSYFDDSRGEYVLLSHSGNEEYKCSGVCYCEGGRRVLSGSNPVIRKGLVYLVSALTSIIAMNIAKEYFKSECVKHADLCPQESIKVEIEECKPFHPTHNSVLHSSDGSIPIEGEILDDDEEDISHNRKEQEHGAEENQENKNHRYWCKGYCKYSGVYDEFFKTLINPLENYGNPLSEKEEKLAIIKASIRGETQRLREFCEKVVYEGEVSLPHIPHLDPKVELNDAKVEHMKVMADVCRDSGKKFLTGLDEVIVQIGVSRQDLQGVELVRCVAHDTATLKTARDVEFSKKKNVLCRRVF